MCRYHAVADKQYLNHHLNSFILPGFPVFIFSVFSIQSKKRLDTKEHCIITALFCHDNVLDTILHRFKPLEFDAVNDDLSEIIEQYGNNSRKITCDYYIDDKAVLPESFTLSVFHNDKAGCTLH